MNTISLRRVLGLVLVFVVICGGFIVLDRRSTLDPIRSGLNEIVSPVSSAFYGVVDRADRRSDVEEELDQVIAERDALIAENSQLKADTAELEQLRQMQAVEDRNPDLELTMAKVLGFDPTGSQMSITIDLGSDDGIRTGMAIVSPNFYIGQVIQVSQETSKVMLIIDASQSVGAMLQDSRGEGIVTGQWQHGGYLSLFHVQPERAPKEGEWVVTSESTETQTRQVPPNIPIGKVLGEPEVSAQTDTLEIQVRPGVSNFSDLTVVYVAMIADD
jgi:rod shape-determining protein MreC